MSTSDSTESAPRRRPLVLAVAAGVLAVPIAVTGLFGGLRSKSAGAARVAPGAVVDQGLVRVRILDARAGNIRFGSFEPPKNRLIVRMHVTDTGDESMGVSTFADGVVAEPKPGTYIEPNTFLSNAHIGREVSTEIHPDLPVDVELVWDLPAGTTPASVTIGLREWEYGQSFTTNTFGWTVSKSAPPIAKVPLRVRPGATS